MALSNDNSSSYAEADNNFIIRPEILMLNSSAQKKGELSIVENWNSQVLNSSI